LCSFFVGHKNTDLKTYDDKTTKILFFARSELTM